MVVFCSVGNEEGWVHFGSSEVEKQQNRERWGRGQTEVADEDAVAEGLQGLDEAHHRAFAGTSSAHREGHSAQVFSAEKKKRRVFVLKTKGRVSPSLFFQFTFSCFHEPFSFPFLFLCDCVFEGPNKRTAQSPPKHGEREHTSSGT